MASTGKRYPLSASNGRAIPLDVIRPYGVLNKTFTAVVSGSVALPSDIEIMSIIVTEDCYMRFGATASVPADGTVLTDTVFLSKYMRTTVAPTATSFTIIGATTSGLMIAQLIDKWTGLTLQTKIERK